MRPSRSARALLACALLAACAPVHQSVPTLGPLETSDPEVARGERAFAYHCSPCHPNATKGLAPSIVNKPLPGWAVRFQVRHGLGQMPGFSEEEIDDDELDAIVAYLDALRARLLAERSGSSGDTSDGGVRSWP